MGIDISSLHTGDTVGEHTVLFQLPGEALEITHRAIDRDGFARGALESSCWLNHQSTGFYDHAGFSEESLVSCTHPSGSPPARG